MQPLEKVEDLFCLLGGESDAVVPELYLIKSFGAVRVRAVGEANDGGFDADAQRAVSGAVFQGVPEQVRKQLGELKSDAVYERQVAAVDGRTQLVDRVLMFGDRTVKDGVQVNR